MKTNYTAQELLALQPDPIEPRAEEVERYVEALQVLAETDPDLARRQTWNQVRLAGMRAGRRRAEAHDSLNRVFRLGNLPEPMLDGRLDGVAITPTTFATTDPVLLALSSVWMPWVGKRFDAEKATGDNIMLPSARLPAKLFWPSYRFQDLGEGRYAAFRFRTYAGAGVVDPDREVLKIDYDSNENPGFLIRDILDELVQLVPGVYLGKVLLGFGKLADANRRLVGYFGLRSPTLSPLLAASPPRA
jgi:hypothetical protein